MIVSTVSAAARGLACMQLQLAVCADLHQAAQPGLGVVNVRVLQLPTGPRQYNPIPMQV